jgi:hypothetical protein
VHPAAIFGGDLGVALGFVSFSDIQSKPIRKQPAGRSGTGVNQFIRAAHALDTVLANCLEWRNYFARRPPKVLDDFICHD